MKLLYLIAILVFLVQVFLDARVEPVEEGVILGEVIWESITPFQIGLFIALLASYPIYAFFSKEKSN